MTRSSQAAPHSVANAPVPPHYRALALLASGRAGDVYLCIGTGDGNMGRPVAVKVLHEQISSHDAYSKTLLDELARLAKVSHPNLAAVQEVGISHDRLFVAMPYIEGGSLGELMEKRRKPVPLWLVVRALSDTLRGLQAAHSAVGHTGTAIPIIHGSVSPGNILLDTYGRARLAGFGFAAAFSHVQESPNARFNWGVYRAPEQIIGGTIDRRTDVFAAGATLWAALVGRPPFVKNNEIINPAVAPPSHVRSELPQWFDAICLRAMRLDPIDRYQSADEMKRAVQNAAAMADGAGSSQDVGRLVTESFADEIARRREQVGESRSHRRDPNLTPKPLRQIEDKPQSGAQIAAAVYFQDRLFEEDEPPSWVYLESPLAEKPRNLDALHPHEFSQRRRRILGLAIITAVLCVVAALGVFQILRSKKPPAPDATRAPVTAPTSDARSPAPQPEKARPRARSESP